MGRCRESLARLSAATRRQRLVLKCKTTLGRRKEATRRRKKDVNKQELALRRREMLVRKRELLVKRREVAARRQEKATLQWEEALVQREVALYEREQAADQREATRSFGTVPDEVLEKVFSYLTTEDLIFRVLPVCRRWHSVAQSRILSRHLEFGHMAIPPEQALRLIRSAPNLQSLKLQWYPEIVELLRAAAGHCKELRRLAVTCSDNNSVAMTAALNALFRTCRHIHDLNLTCIPLSNASLICRGLGVVLPHLRKVSIYCRWFSPSAIDALIEGCGEMLEFKAVFCACSDANIRNLARRWGHSLVNLELKASELTDVGIAALAGCTELRRLMLWSLKTPGVGMRKLKDLALLEEIDLNRAESIRARNWRKFFLGSCSANRLRKIRLFHCSGVDDGVLAALGASCSSLEDLDVAECNHVSDAGLRKVLSGCRCLVRLNIEDTSDSVAQVLTQLPQLAPQLRWVKIHYSIERLVGFAAMINLQSQMPKLSIQS